MTGPYGIAQVDIPGVLGAYEAGQTNRTNRLYRQQQLQMLERQADRQQRFDEILLGNAARPQPGQPGSSGSAPSGGVAGAYATPGDVLGSSMSAGSGGMIGTAPAAPPAPAPAPQQATTIPDNLLRQMAFLDPERAGQIFTALRTMDQATSERVNRLNLTLANRAQHLLSNVPPEQWGTEIQRMAPELMQLGVSQEMLSDFQPTEQALRGVVQEAMDIERLAAVANQRPIEVGPGARLVDTQRRGGVTQAREVYTNPVTMVNGVPYATPGAGQQYRDGETRTVNGTTYVRQGGVWRAQGNAQPTSGEAPAFRPAPGGAVSGQQAFP